jgi:hypothetical protein
MDRSRIYRVLIIRARDFLLPVSSTCSTVATTSRCNSESPVLCISITMATRHTLPKVHFSGLANDNSCPSGSGIWKCRSPHEASRGLSGSKPKSVKCFQSASTSATYRIIRPQPIATTQLQVQDCRLRVFGAKRRKAVTFAAMQQFHAEHLPIELHRCLHIPDPKRHRRNLLHCHCHSPQAYRSFA